MAMLAESRSRQKWSDDPRNTRWANDKSKFGYQMLTRMGWSEGKGLGQNESGQTSHVKVKKRKGNSGIGSKHSHDDDWISHQNDFNDLLSALNQGSTSNDNSIKSLEDRVKSSRKKILYTKFVKSKDLSNASSRDLACIFGTRSKSAPATPNLSDDDDEDEGSTSDASAASCPTYTAALTNPKTEHGFTTINTGVSVADYFAKKMAALKNNAKEEHNRDLEQIVENTIKKKIKNKKTKMLNTDDTDINENLHNIVVKRKKKKKRKMDSDIELNNDKNVPEDPDTPDDPDDLKPKKKKKRKTVGDDIDVKTLNSEDHDSHEKKKKKKKKEKKRRSNEMT